MLCFRDGWRGIAMAALAGVLCPLVATATTLKLKDGRQIVGEFSKVTSLNQNTRNTVSANASSLLVVDNNLQRIFLPLQQVASVDPTAAPVEMTITLKQPVSDSGGRVASVGPLRIVQEWDAHGRRTVRVGSGRGPIDIVQGITRITPRWVRVEALHLAGQQSFVWDLRMATSSIPWGTLREILVNRRDFDPAKFDHRIEVVKLALQSGRYQDALTELEKVQKDFPQEQQLAENVRSLNQMNARRILDEIRLRQRAGQYQFTRSLLEQFPQEGMDPEVLVELQEAIDQQTHLKERHDQVLADVARCVESLKNDTLQNEAKLVVEEMRQQLSPNTLDRLADFARLSTDENLSAEEKSALAINGWLQGSGEGGTNLNLALSMFHARDLVLKFLREPDKLGREQLLKQVLQQEGVTPVAVARLVSHLAAPLPPPPQDKVHPGLYHLAIAGFDKEPDVEYWVQLPPEYDPLRSYPVIVTLHGVGNSPLDQLDWWAGEAGKDGARRGQAMRQGYIVVAPAWAKSDQTEYEYSAREHAAVLGCLRDACRHFSIHSDRVYLTGHGMGGDAVWDLGLAHPDLWAGVIPIIATIDKYSTRYWENAKLLPLYVVAGELDGDKTAHNATTLDRLLRGNFDITVVEYQGRGQEGFSDEILNLFDWMGRKQRNFFPEKFEARTFRSWDNFFWWLELTDYPERGAVEPIDWPPKANQQPLKIAASLQSKGVRILSGPSGMTLWLSPELIDLNQKLKIEVKGRTLPSKNPQTGPDLEVLLEDVRSRGDRLHPFWAKITL